MWISIFLPFLECKWLQYPCEGDSEDITNSTRSVDSNNSCHKPIPLTHCFVWSRSMVGNVTTACGAQIWPSENTQLVCLTPVYCAYVVGIMQLFWLNEIKLNVHWIGPLFNHANSFGWCRASMYRFRCRGSVVSPVCVWCVCVCGVSLTARLRSSFSASVEFRSAFLCAKKKKKEELGFKFGSHLASTHPHPGLCNVQRKRERESVREVERERRRGRAWGG